MPRSVKHKSSENKSWRILDSFIKKIISNSITYQNLLKSSYSNISFMKKKKSKKKQTNSNLNDQKLGQTKNSAKLVLFVFGIGPIIGIIIFLYSKGFFNSPTI